MLTLCIYLPLSADFVLLLFGVVSFFCSLNQVKFFVFLSCEEKYFHLAEMYLLIVFQIYL